MNQQDREAIDGVFQRVAEVERQGAVRDPEAERLIAEHLRANPAAAYYLAQTVIVQERALKNASQDPGPAASKGEELSAAGTPLRSSSGALGQSGNQATPNGAGTAFGNEGFGRSTPNYAPQQQTATAASQFGNSAGGGFLAGAAQTAMGVAGGMMLGSMLGNMFGGNHAHAAEASKDPAANTDHAADTTSQDGSNTATTAADDGGGLFGNWFGGGDDGGGFDDI